MTIFEKECVMNLKVNGFTVSENDYGEMRLNVIGKNISYDYYKANELYILQKIENGERTHYASVSEDFKSFMSF